jgi:5-methylcytosine-specific restriction protein B
MDVQKKDEFLGLLKEFVEDYLPTPEGQKHIESYEPMRTQGRRNLSEIIGSSDRGEDVTDAVLLKLLPYADTDANRKKGAWIHIAPAIQGDLRAWFQNVGWTKPEDWPGIANAIVAFLRQCQDGQGNIEVACEDFARLPHSKGFQAGMLSPILNALQPTDLIIINGKSRRVVNHFASTNLSQSIADYPRLNRIGKDIHSVIPSTFVPANAATADIFDMFCHWLVTIKQHAFGDERYWKIAPGERASEWTKCLEGGFIGIGWEDIGDLSKVSFVEFVSMQESFANERKDIPGWSKTGTNQAWKFAKEIKEGDRIIANRGTTEVVGIGNVVGPYYFVAGEPFGHRIPVDWSDTRIRTINEGSWIKTLIELKKTKFEQIEALISPPPPPPPPNVASISEKTFQLLAMLNENPRADVYNTHKDDFKIHVEASFQHLFKKATARLPASVTQDLETEKNIFSRIPKNDYGQGGAWDYYWGALYPKSGKRVEDAQLFLWIGHDRMRAGFYIGDYGNTARERFSKNCTTHHEELRRLLGKMLSDDRFVFGDAYIHVDLTTLEAARPGPTGTEWIRDPSIAGIAVAWTLPKEKVISMPQDELVKSIAEVHAELYPLVLLSLSDDPMQALRAHIGAKPLPPSVNPAFPLEACSQATGIPVDTFTRWVRAIHRKKQSIIYGPPGTGKTFVAEQLAKHIVGDGDGFVTLVQFHPSYAYEDFVQGLRPQARDDGGLDYPLVPGVFLEFCKDSNSRSGYCVLIIDEINRANLSRVFGELMYLLEYRNSEIALASGGNLRIPETVRIIGTMNTADRSIALVDHALRRRFAFISLYPDFVILRRFHETTGINVDGLIETLASLNEEIGDRHYALGISFFLLKDLKDHIEDIWRMEIEPYIEEYFFDRPGKAEEYRWEKIAQKVNL